MSLCPNLTYDNLLSGKISRWGAGLGASAVVKMDGPIKDICMYLCRIHASAYGNGILCVLQHTEARKGNKKDISMYICSLYDKNIFIYVHTDIRGGVR